jgi:uncharacterized membrane protein required for colicin V production
MLISIIVVILLILSFFGGLKEGAVKNFFNLLTLLIAIPLTGLYYELVAGWLSFLPENWANFIGFYIVLTILVVILSLVFMIPRRIIQRIWGKGFLYRLSGGVIGLFYGAVAMVLFTLVIFTFPIFDFLAQWLAGSGVLAWLVNNLAFVLAMLPEVFEKTAGSFTTLFEVLL